jgi:hypothetical protein
MKQFTVYADIGSVKIQLKDGAIFLNNGVGDGEYKVYIGTQEESQSN